MNSLRRTLCWLFAFSAFACAQVVFFDVIRVMQATRLSAVRGSLAVAVLFAPLGLLFGISWWTIWKGKRSARLWALISSVANIAIAVWPLFVFRDHSFFSPLLVSAGLGIAGLIAFWRPYQEPALATESDQNPPNGDGTFAILNKFADFLGFMPVIVAFPWWIHWCGQKNLPESDVPVLLILLVVGLPITVVHELGHTVVGLLLGMRLRALLMGPLQWTVSEGAWRFQFSLARLLMDDGGTSVVPTTPEFSRGKHLAVSVGGPLASLISGAVALSLAITSSADSPLQAAGAMSLFGAFSLGTGLINLVPFRSRNTYSDGARIRQLMTDGPWAEVHRTFALVGASLVTSLRPKDFDIAAIDRASEVITSGPQALQLRLFAFIYYLDTDNLEAAGAALRKPKRKFQAGRFLTHSNANSSLAMRTCFETPPLHGLGGTSL